MAFTTGNDINILTSVDGAVVGAGAGNDRYVLDASVLTANQKITISDTQGANTLQLAGGLEIVSSQVTANAVQLTLNNGAVITVLGASTFNFQTGGNTINGAGGSVQSFGDFVTTSLGLAAVPTGSTPVSGGTVTVVEAGGTTGGTPVVPGATYALTAGAAAADEGTTATFNLVTTGLAAGAEVAYTLSGIDAADLASGALTGKAIVGADGKATISVALAADHKTEGAETLTVTAGGQSASTVVNDTSVALGYTLAASATNLVEEGQQITFTVTPTAVSATAVTLYVQISGASVGAITTQATADDFSAVLLPVTIPAGSMAPVVVSTTVTADATTEGPEGFQAKLLDSAFAIVPDVAALTGTITEGVSTVKTFMLTKGLDNVAGTSGNDTIIGSIGAAELTTLSTLDVIDGGAGVDTLQVLTESATITLGAGIKNVEIVEARSAGALDVNTSVVTDVQTLKVTGAVGNAAAKAAATTDIAVKLDATTSNAITTQGGKNISVELANAAAGADSVTVGVLTGAVVGEAAKGDVTVSVTGKAQVAAATTTLGDIAVNGGKTISVTQKATSDASAAATSKVANSVTQGNVAIAADAATTTVTVKQDAAVAGKVAQDTTGGITETVSVKFGALKAADSVTVHGLTLTAKVDLTAAEVASAFANLVDGKVPTAGVDTQGSGLVSTKGTYSGTFAASPAAANNWTTAAANADTVVFTATRPNVDANPLVITGAAATGSVAPVPTVTNGKIHDATPAGGVLTVAAGKVEVTGAAALKTVTVDGFAGSSFVNSATALETLNLSNGFLGTAGTIVVDAAAETLNVNLNNFGVAAVAPTLTTSGVTANTATLDLNAATTKTLNVKVEGKSNASLALDGAGAVAALNVSGTSSATVSTSNAALTTVKVTESAGLTVATASGTLTSVDTTGTTGTVTATIDGGKATYAGGAGVDNVTVSGTLTGGVLNKSINLGAGNDKLDLSDAALTATILKAIPTADAYQGGEGTDTIVLTAANAVALSADSTFAGKIDGFEKLSITNATAAGTVNLANLDNINYVISANSAPSASAAVAQVFSVDFASSGTIIGADTVEFAGTTLTLAGNETATGIALAFAGKSFTGWNVTKVEGTKVYMTSTTVGVTTAVGTGDFTIVDTDTATVTANASNFVPGVAADSTKASFDLTVSATGTIEDADTLTILGVQVALANGNNEAAIVSAIQGAAFPGWVVTVSGSVLTFTQAVAADLAVIPANASGLYAQAAVNTTKPVISVVTETASADAGTPAPALTIDKMASGGTLELTAVGAGASVNVTDAIKGTADVLNVVVNAANTVVGGVTTTLGTVKAAEVETINVSVANKTTTFSTVYGDVKVADPASVSTLALDANAAKAVTVTGAGNLTLSLSDSSTSVGGVTTWSSLAAKVATVDASAATGALTLDLTNHNGVAVTVTGGAGNDVLSASVGTNAKADVLVGGAGNDTLVAGSNGAKLTGGAGNDLFVLSTAGTKEANTYSSILDFQAGDVLQISGLAGANQFGKLTATLNENTSVFSNFVDAAILQAGANEAVWFQFKGNAYVVVDQGADTAAFVNGTDSVIELVGVDLANASFNSASHTVALV